MATERKWTQGNFLVREMFQNWTVATAAQTVCLKTQETGYRCILWHIKDMGYKTQ